MALTSLYVPLIINYNQIDNFSIFADAHVLQCTAYMITDAETHTAQYAPGLFKMIEKYLI